MNMKKPDEPMLHRMIANNIYLSKIILDAMRRNGTSGTGVDLGLVVQTVDGELTLDQLLRRALAEENERLAQQLTNRP